MTGKFSQNKRLFDIPYHQLANYPQDKAFSYRENECWKSISIREFIKQCSKLSIGLLKLGLSKGDKIAIISSHNCTPWHIVDIAASQIGVCLVPLYPNSSDQDYEYILNHSEALYCFVSDDILFNKIERVKDKLPFIKRVYSFNKVKNCANWEELLTLGEDLTFQKKLEEVKESINADDLTTIIYTSGTTGVPKGVMLSHNNIMSNVLSCKIRLPVKEGSVALSFLPISHIYERTIIYLYIYAGVSVFFAESLDKIGENIREVRPHIITAVPRLLEKIYDKIYDKGTALKGIKKYLFFWAIKLGIKYNPSQKMSFLERLKLMIARKMIFSKWLKALGGRLKTIVSGSSPLQLHLAKIFSACGITILEGYGLTETSPVISVGDANIGEVKLGAVGKPLHGLEVKIAEDGEILCKGASVMKGYYKDKRLTSEVMKQNYFQTGDLGFLDNDGFLHITGRKKELFKTSGGKYIAPQLIENKMKLSPLIEQIIVVGEGEKMPAAIIQPNFKWLSDYSKDCQFGASHQNFLEDIKVLDFFQKEIDIYNKTLNHWEKIKKFALTPDTWTVEHGHLTPSMKPKREKLLIKYQNLYRKMYS